MGNWRVVAAVLVGLICTAAVVVRGVGTGLFGGILPGSEGDIRDAVRGALEHRDTAGRPIHILSESDTVDRAIRWALPPQRHTRAALLRRDAAGIAEAMRGGEILALQNGRRYLELLGFELEWLPQSASQTAFPWARVRRRLNCAQVREDRWSPLPGVEYTGRLGVQLPADLDGQIVFVIGDEVPLDVEVQGLDGMPIPLLTEVLRPGPASGAPADFWLDDGNPWSAPGAVVRLTIEAQPARDRLLGLRLGRRAPRVLARLQDYESAARAEVCAASLGVDEAFGQANDLVVLPDTPEYFGTGWYGTEMSPRGLGAVRWMKAQGVILVPSARRGAVHVSISGAPAATIGEPATLTLTVNGVFAPPAVTLAPEGSNYRWTVPTPVWLAGTNELLFAISRTARTSEHGQRDLGFALQRLDLSLIADH